MNTADYIRDNQISKRDKLQKKTISPIFESSTPCSLIRSDSLSNQ